MLLIILKNKISKIKETLQQPKIFFLKSMLKGNKHQRSSHLTRNMNLFFLNET